MLPQNIAPDEQPAVQGEGASSFIIQATGDSGRQNQRPNAPLAPPMMYDYWIRGDRLFYRPSPDGSQAEPGAIVSQTIIARLGLVGHPNLGFLGLDTNVRDEDGIPIA